MDRRSLVRVLLSAALAASGGGQAIGAAPSPSAPGSSAEQSGPGSLEAGESELRLSGPFGTVPGVDPRALPLATVPPAGVVAPSPWPRSLAEAGGRPLHDRPIDAYVLRAPLRLEAGRPARPLVRWLVTATVEEAGSSEVLAESAMPLTLPTSLRFEGPARPGRHRLSAWVVDASGAELEATWVLDVPDREPPDDGLLEVPAPDLRLTGSSAEGVGWAGNGCYVYLCVEVGRLPPLATLEPLTVRAGEPLHLALSDGSGISSWTARYQRMRGNRVRGRRIPAGGAAVGAAAMTLEAPPVGDWLLRVEIEYDRERGWRQVLYRLRSTERAGVTGTATTPPAPSPPG